MDSVASVVQAQPEIALPQAPDTASAAESLTADFDTFLQLLTTQMRNQDPQNPQDSTEFVAQLASFSAVEQQISTNTKLDALVESLTAGSTQQMASWIGADVRSSAATPFDGTPIEAHFSIPEGATIAQLIVSTEGGTEIRRMTLSPGATSETWDGKGNDGLDAPSGDYNFAVEAFDQSKSLGRLNAETFSRVVEVRNGENGMALVLSLIHI